MAPTVPTFTHQVDRSGSMLTVYLAGELDLLVVGLGEAIIDAIGADTRRVVLDLSELTFCDSTGLGQMVAARQRADEIGADFQLYQPTSLVRAVIEAAGLTDVLPIRG